MTPERAAGHPGRAAAATRGQLRIYLGSAPGAGTTYAMLSEGRRRAEHGDDVVLCVHNLSRFHQPVEFNLQHWASYIPVELTGHVSFPRIGQLPYLLTVQGHGVMWFMLTPDPSKR